MKRMRLNTLPIGARAPGRCLAARCQITRYTICFTDKTRPREHFCLLILVDAVISIATHRNCVMVSGRHSIAPLFDNFGLY